MAKKIMLAGFLVVAVAYIVVGCGVKGPPQPPKIPAAQGS